MAVTEGLDVYLDVAGADAYWAARNNSTWEDADLTDKERALLEGTQYLDGAFDWKGERYGLSQTLAWPRFGVEADGVPVAATTVPQKVKDATAELALEGLQGRLLPAAARGGAIERVKAGSVEIAYAEGAPTRRTFGFVTLLLRGLFLGGAGTRPLRRV